MLSLGQCISAIGSSSHATCRHRMRTVHTHTQCAQCAHTHTRRRSRTFYKCWRGFVFEGLEHPEIENYHRNDWKYFKWILYCMLWYVNFQPLKSVLHSIWTVLHLAITFPSKVWCSVLLFFLQIFKFLLGKCIDKLGLKFSAACIQGCISLLPLLGNNSATCDILTHEGSSRC